MKHAAVLVLTVAALTASPILFGQRQGGAAPDGRQGGAAQAGQRGGGAQGRQDSGRQARGAPGRGQVGRSVIRGRVVASDTGAPVRRAQVAAQGGGPPRAVTTDVDGRFEFRDLPGGRWTLQASKAGFVTLKLGQRRSFESVPPLDVADGQRIDNADFILSRGGAITGRVYDEFGDPIANARAQVLRYQMVRGRRQLSQTGVTAVTDDLGAFRLYGLAPGQYYVGARSATGPLDLGPEGTGTYAPTYFPGTINVSEAQPVSLNIGQEQNNVSFALLPVRTVRISGTVLDSTGSPLGGGIVNLTTAFDSNDNAINLGASGRVLPDASFTLTNVIPGSYTLVAMAGPGRRGNNAAAGAAFAGGPIAEVAYMPIVISSDLAGIVVTTVRGATLAGTVTHDTGSGLETMSGIRVQAQPLRPGPGISQQTATVGSSGVFTLSGLIGPSILRVEQLPQGWMVARIEVNGVDVSDSPIEFRGTERGTARVVLTNRIPEVSGTVIGGRQTSSGYQVVIFPDDPAKWAFPSRYVRSARTDPKGTFAIRALPAHDRYLAVAVDYLEDGEATDPEFLRSIRKSATSLPLREGETRILELTLVER